MHRMSPMRLEVLGTTPSRPPLLESGPRSIAAVRVLRISITDRCNYRCLYCMPEQGVRWLPQEQILSFEEICEVVKAAIEIHGIRRFKLTGGEPTVRHGLVDLVAMLRRIGGIEDLSLTTNGQRLSDLAEPLRQAGLDRVTVSIDSLVAEKFRRITRTGDLAAVLRGLDRCEEAGFKSLKINCVTMRGTNDDELVDFAALSLHRNLTVRFIEYMPLGDAALLSSRGSTGFRPVSRGVASGEISNSRIVRHGLEAHATHQAYTTDQTHVAGTVSQDELGPAGGCGAQDRGADSLIPESEVRAMIERSLGPLIPVDRSTESGVGPANVYRLARGSPQGRIGLISAMSAPFCSTCNRLRLTANGLLRSCLFEGGEVDVRAILRDANLASTRRLALAQAMTDCVRLKPEVHSHHGNQQMSRIGG